MQGLPTTSHVQAGWLPRGERRPGCPPGLENLVHLDFFWVQQEMEQLEMIHGVETENRYYVKNHSGLNIFYAMEKSTYCARNCGCCGCRPFEMRVSDYSGSEVIHLSRPCTCCFDEIRVYCPPGVVAGSVNRTCGFCRPSFSVYDPAGNKFLGIRGPCCVRSCCCFGSCCSRNVNFNLVGVRGDKLGKISKQWDGYGGSSDSDTFGISFPADLEVRMKAVVLGACILIDMVYFEDRAKKDKNMTNQRVPR